MFRFSKFLVGDIISFFLGALLVCAFAPFNIFFLGIFCPAALLILWLSTALPRIFWRGWLFGLGFFGVGVHWVYFSIYTFGQAPFLIALFITLLFISGLSLFPACQAYLLKKIFPNKKMFFAFPAVWVLFEGLRTWLFTGFPWLLLGYSQINSPLRGYAPLFSVYGVSLATVLTSSLLVALFFYKTFRARFFIISTLIVLWLMGWQLNKIQWTHPIRQPIKVALIQGNISQSVKWQPEQAVKNLFIYTQLTKPYLKSDLIVWPEAAITFTQHEAKDFLEQYSSIAKENHTAVITGIPIEKDFQFFNGMIVLGENSNSYLKRHLVPFGEYFPLKFLWGWLFKSVVIPMSDMTPGAKKQIDLIARGITIGPSICYEIAYPNEIANLLPRSDLLVTISDDSWFGKSIAQAQQFQMTQMRALETGRYVLAATNDGVTGIIDAQGNVIARAPSYQAYALTGTVTLMQGSTPWIRWGIFPLMIFLFLLFIAAVIPAKAGNHPKNY